MLEGEGWREWQCGYLKNMGLKQKGEFCRQNPPIRARQ
jgi:hypothetical protein